MNDETLKLVSESASASLSAAHASHDYDKRRNPDLIYYMHLLDLRYAL